MSKKCTPLWREAHLEVKSVHKLGFSAFFDVQMSKKCTLPNFTHLTNFTSLTTLTNLTSPTNLVNFTHLTNFTNETNLDKLSNQLTN